MNRPWTVVLADSDAEVIRLLREVIEGETELLIAGETADGPSTLELLDRTRPDMAILGLGLPQLNALDVLQSLRPRDWPRALYLLDPTARVTEPLFGGSLEVIQDELDLTRIRRLLDRATLRLDASRNGHREQISSLLATRRNETYLHCLPIRHAGRIEVLSLDDVDWIAAAGNYVELHGQGRRLLYRSALSTLSKRLDPERFVRIHRSTVVNAERVCELHPTPQGDFKLLLDTGEWLRLSRRFGEAIERFTARRQLQERAQ